MEVKERIGILEETIKKKVKSYLMINEDKVFFIVKTNPGVFQNNLYLVDSKGKVSIADPKYFTELKEEDFKHI